MQTCWSHPVCTRAAESDESNNRGAQHMGKWSTVLTEIWNTWRNHLHPILIYNTQEEVGVSAKSQKWVIYILKNDRQKSAQGCPRYTNFCNSHSQKWCKMILLHGYQIAKWWYGWSVVSLNKLQMDSNKTGTLFWMIPVIYASFLKGAS